MLVAASAGGAGALVLLVLLAVLLVRGRRHAQTLPQTDHAPTGPGSSLSSLALTSNPLQGSGDTPVPYAWYAVSIADPLATCVECDAGDSLGPPPSAPWASNDYSVGHVYETLNHYDDAALGTALHSGRGLPSAPLGWSSIKYSIARPAAQEEMDTDGAPAPPPRARSQGRIKTPAITPEYEYDDVDGTNAYEQPAGVVLAGERAYETPVAAVGPRVGGAAAVYRIGHDYAEPNDDLVQKPGSEYVEPAAALPGNTYGRGVYTYTLPEDDDEAGRDLSFMPETETADMDSCV